MPKEKPLQHLALLGGGGEPKNIVRIVIFLQIDKYG